MVGGSCEADEGQDTIPVFSRLFKAFCIGNRGTQQCDNHRLTNIIAAQLSDVGWYCRFVLQDQ